MKFSILLAMGLVASTALVGAERAVNAFLTVEGGGVDDDGSIVVDRNSPDSVKVSARPGWLVNGRESVSVDPKRGLWLKVMSRLGEDEVHVHLFSYTREDEHIENIELSAEAVPASKIAMYALPDTSTVVSISAMHEVTKRGKHKETTTYYPCVCGETHNPQEVVRIYEVEPDCYEWTASGAGQTVKASMWTGQMSKGLRQSIEFTVVGNRDDCALCMCTASTNNLVDVHELSVANDLYLGLDRTDFGRTNPVVKVAAALIDPEPTGSSAYSWTDCGICAFTGRTDRAQVRYFVPDPDKGSAHHLDETLTVRGTATNAEELSASANCTTNCTVVKVDVTIGGVGEEKEEKEGAFIQHVADAANGQWTEEGTNALVAVSITCEPENLPADEMIKISAPAKSLYIRHNGKYYVIPDETNFPAYLLPDVEFVLHGHDESSGFCDREIKVEHKRSGAVDVAKFASVKLCVTNIRFNHDTSSSDKDAINIRRSYTEEIDVSNGEWYEFGDVLINEPFCYTTNRAVTVKVRFEASSFITSAMIQARCIGVCGSLSSLMPTNVVFVNGVSSPEYVEFKMEENTLSYIDRSLGGMLSWTADSVNGQSGCKMNDSGPHLVYTILGEPKPPWKNAHGEHENAWTNALEFAIVKAGAQGKSTDKDALAAITKYLHNGHGLVYDTVEGAPRYWDPATGVFSATTYITVSNSAGVTNLVNCYDQAHGVVTLGNILGPSVNAIPRFTMPFGYINTTNLVGVGACNNPFYDSTNEWAYVNITGTGSVSFGKGIPPKVPVCNVDDNTRTWFGNHMYVTYHAGGYDYVFDACAGPFIGGISKTNYLNNAIDHSTIDERELSFYGGTIINLPKKDEDYPINFPIN